VSRDDPDTVALARSIGEFGVKEPLVITRDGYILSGHRRYVAAQMAGLEMVPVRVEPITRGDPEFMVLLREYNRQRVKGLDEVLREEAVSANAEVAYTALLSQRAKRAAVDVEEIFIRGETQRDRISRAKQPFLRAIQKVIDSLAAYWPLTDRQVHYNLLNDPPLRHANKPETHTDKKGRLRRNRYSNNLESYKDTCDMLTRGRLAGDIPWNAIGDETRPVCVWQVWASPGPFVRRGLKGFLRGYARDLLRSQPNHIEIVGEKNTIEGIIRPVASRHCVPYTIGRGYASLDPRRKMYQRFRKSGKEKLVLLVLSDFDAEGENIPHSFARSMRDDFGVEEVVAVKAALTHAQVEGAGLHPNRLKEGSSRAKWFREKYGEDTYELEAVPPDTLQDYLRKTIEAVIDTDAFNAEVNEEKRDARFLARVRSQALGLFDRVPGARDEEERDKRPARDRHRPRWARTCRWPLWEIAP
jgi:hypothetical protein